MAPYRSHHHDVRWTLPGSWHLTLLFLGAVRPERLPELRVLMEDVAGGLAPYRVRADAGGGRILRGEGVGWLGLSVGAGTVIALAHALAEACAPGVTDGPPPRRTPAAHLTVVRRAHPSTIEALRSQALGPLGIEWRVDRLSLARSYLERDGARYETLHEVTM